MTDANDHATMGLGARLRIDLPQLEHMTRAAANPRVDHLEVLVAQSDAEVVSYLIVKRGDVHWLPVRRRRDGLLVDRCGQVLEYDEGS